MRAGDLRIAHEITEQPNVFAGSRAVTFHHYDFWGIRFDDYRSLRPQATVAEKLADLYCCGRDKSGFVMAEIMKTIANRDDTGVAWHYPSGRDRTGLVTTLLLRVVNVSERTVCVDFVLTTSYLKPAKTDTTSQKPTAYLKGRAPDTMTMTLSFFHAEYGDVSDYPRHIGVSGAQARRSPACTPS